MDVKEKLDMINYCSYRYKGKNWDSNETKDFFDLEFSNVLAENSFDIMNSQIDLLSFFDFNDIFSNFNNGITDIQSSILKFMTIKGVQGVNELLKNMPHKLELNFFYQLYADLQSKNNSPFWFSKIISCIKKEDIIIFVNELINQVTDDELFYMIQNLYTSKDDKILSELMHNERIADIAVKKINAPFFYEMVEDLNLPTQLLDKRKNELKNVLINYQEYNISDVKAAFCDLYLHNNLKNSVLDIKTIVDFAKDDAKLREEYLSESYDYLCKVYDFLNHNELSQTDIQIINSDININSDMISKCYLLCQKRFKDLMSDSINKDVTKGIDPKTLISSAGHKVEFYNIENQTEHQKNVTMLLSTIPCSDNAQKFKEIYYSEDNGEIKKGRRSCSLVNETKLSSLFGGKNRIIFGYDDLTGRTITSATLGDGRTDGNEEKFRKHRKVVKSSYSTINKFISGTQGHTEVTVNMGDTNEVMKPSYILIMREEPTQFEIDVAAEFQIPIRYININKYEQLPDNEYMPEDYEYKFEKTEINNLQKKL